VRQVQPGEDDDFVANLHPIQPVSERGEHFEPRVGRSLSIETWGICDVFQLGSNEANWLDHVFFHESDPSTF
jgi:hypothetical protein